METLKRPLGLGLALFCLAITLSVSTAWKGYCANGIWTDGRQYHALCYSDIVPLFDREQLAGDRLPYLDRCPSTPDAPCDEYPVLSMYFMRIAAWLGGPTHAAFFYANALMLIVCALAALVCLYLLVGRQALWFALAPTLLAYAFVNWDLLAVALATGALLAFLNRRDAWAGILVGLGAAAKLYPALFLVPFIAERIRSREPDRAITLGWSAAASWIAVNLPFIVRAPGPWSTFFRFNATRGPDWDSLWYIACRDLQHQEHCLGTGTVNVLSADAAIVVALVIWAAKARRAPYFPRWSLVFPFVVMFLLTSKVYSPQYGLWLLPLLILALPDFGWFAAFSVADLAVFVTRFWFFGHYQLGSWGVPEWTFEVAVVVRDLVLVGCLIAWYLREPNHPALPAADAAVEAEAAA